MHDVRINRSAIQSLGNSTGRSKKFLWDREVPGFGVYKTASGLPTFVYQYRSPLNKATVRRDTLGVLGELTVEQARDLARDRAHQRRSGIDPILARREAAKQSAQAEELSLATYADDLIRRREVDQKPFSKEIQEIIRRDIVGTMGDVRLDQITYKFAEDAANKLAERSISAKRWFIVYLKVIVNDAISRDLMPGSPVLKIPTPKSTERDRVLSHAEMQRFVEAARDTADISGVVHELLLRLLRRKEEAAAISWSEIDQISWSWTLPASREKTQTALRITLPPAVVAILQKQQPKAALRTGFIFSRTGGRSSARLANNERILHNAHMDRRVELAAKLAGGKPSKIPHFTIHDLRTTAATVMGDVLNIEPHVIEALLNHKLGNKIQRKYQRSTFRTQMDAALIKWNDYLDGLLAQPDAWPGGKDLPPMEKEEINRRHASFTSDWPKRTRKGTDGGDD